MRGLEREAVREWRTEEERGNCFHQFLGIDTRELTKKIREHGTLLGKLIIDGHSDLPFEDPNKKNLVAEVSCQVGNSATLTYSLLTSFCLSMSRFQTSKVYNESGGLKIVAVDCGMKNNQIRCLVERGASVKVVPWNYDFNGDEGEEM